MIRNKLRTSGNTILAALLCVLIGLVIGFTVLTVLSAFLVFQSRVSMLQRMEAYPMEARADLQFPPVAP